MSTVAPRSAYSAAPAARACASGLRARRGSRQVLELMGEELLVEIEVTAVVE
jgi:hypothetical protein